MNMKWVGFLRIVVGIFFLAQGINRVDWFRSSEFLRAELQAYAAHPDPAAHWLLTHAVLPYTEIWARVIPAGEMLIGAALLAGMLSRTALCLALAGALCYDVAAGKLYSPTFITEPAGMVMLACLLTLAVLRSGSVFALKKSRR